MSTSSSSTATGAVGDTEMEELKSPFLRLQRVMSDIVVGEQGSSKATALFLVSCTIGAGTLALPCAFTEVGIGGGFTLLLLSAVGNAYCLFLLTDAAEVSKSFTYEGIARKVLGPAGLSVVQACLLIVLFGIITTQLILIADSLVSIMDVVWPCPTLPASPTAGNVSAVAATAAWRGLSAAAANASTLVTSNTSICGVGDPLYEFLTTRGYLTALVTFCIIFPVSLARDLSHLRLVGGIAPYAILFVVL